MAVVDEVGEVSLPGGNLNSPPSSAQSMRPVTGEGKSISYLWCLLCSGPFTLFVLPF
jgi:hypothetical protein